MSQFKFRTLESNECRIIFVRHGKHKNNILVSEDVSKAKQIGEELKKSGLDIDSAYSSPAQRAEQTVKEILLGMQTVLIINHLAGLSDMKSEDPDIVKKLKADAKERGLSGDAGIAELAFDQNYGLLPLMVKRGWEGATTLVEIATKNPGKTIFAGSHGVARMEVALQVLWQQPVHQLEKIIDPLEMVELIFNTNTGELNEWNWL